MLKSSSNASRQWRLNPRLHHCNDLNTSALSVSLFFCAILYFSEFNWHRALFSQMACPLQQVLLYGSRKMPLFLIDLWLILLQWEVHLSVYVSRPTRCTNSYNESLLIIKCSTRSGLFSPSSRATFLEAVYCHWYKPVHLAVWWL